MAGFIEPFLERTAALRRPIALRRLGSGLLGLVLGAVSAAAVLLYWPALVAGLLLLWLMAHPGALLGLVLGLAIGEWIWP
jgi:hypothetical protein